MIPRLHIEFASESNNAAILKRSPTDWVQLLLWDTSSDVVQAGSWFHGRIYEDGCSISPDGRLFAYAAAKYTGPKTGDVNYAWTAISKPPYLAALSLWAHSDTWGGRASFVDNQTLIIDCPYWETLKTDDPLPTGFSVLPRWIGKDAPAQTLPQASTSDASFNGTTGVDQAGLSFQYEGGLLLRNGKLIVDLNNTKPQPEPPPETAHSW